MISLINDFTKCAMNGNGYGFFEGDRVAVIFAQTMSKTQVRKFRKNGIVPGAFYAYLRAIGVIKKDVPIPRGGSNLDQLLHILQFYPYRSEQARSTGHSLFRGLIEADIPFLKNAFARGDFVWEKLENMNPQKFLK